jgi:methylenetetrahydrofolate reductase (NADPH)
VLSHPIYEITPMSTAATAVAALPPHAEVSVTCSPVKGISATFELAMQAVAHGHAVIPHIAARMVRDHAEVAAIAQWCQALSIKKLFVIAGDADQPHGPFDGGLSFLQAFLGHDHGLSAIGVPGYPDGHGFIPFDVVRGALHAKLALIASAGLEAFVSTQMCFDPNSIAGWIDLERRAGMTAPIHLGVPGAVERTKLLTMGARIGVGASLRYLKKNRAVIRQLVSPNSFDPLELIGPLQSSASALGIIGVHLFTFNQVESTRAWIESLAPNDALVPLSQ